MKKRIERKEERIEAIRAAATRCRGIYSAVAREQGWGVPTYAALWQVVTAVRMS